MVPSFSSKKSNQPALWSENVDRILHYCAALTSGESLLILCDVITLGIALSFARQAEKRTGQVQIFSLPLQTHHGAEPPENIACKMAECDLIVCLTQFSLAHTRARIHANQRGVRFLSLPHYSWKLLENSALSYAFKAEKKRAKRMARALTAATTARITSSKGTNLILNLQDRSGGSYPGFVDDEFLLASPPNSEVNIAPVENQSEGCIVADGSITFPEIGLLRAPVSFSLLQGRISSITSANPHYVSLLEALFQEKDSPRRILGELGIGLNEKAELTGMMLTDEGCAHTIHFGFGSNSTIGGKNEANFHIDVVLSDVSLFLDDRPVIREGVLEF